LITCYAQPDKPKSRHVLEAFAAGCGARMARTDAAALAPGDAAFYGVRPGWMHLLDQAQREGRAWFWLDNAWFDVARECYYRIGCNAVQSWSHQPSDGSRLRALRQHIAPWRSVGKNAGRHIVVCRQSDEFLATVAQRPHWLAEVEAELAKHSERPRIVRHKRCPRPLIADLADAWLLVTHSSAAAIEALLAGVPVIVTDPHCAAARFGTEFAETENPQRPDGREHWAAQLADSQWTLAELASGKAWRDVCKQQAG